MKDYLEETNVQLGASYDIAKQSTESYKKGLEAAAGFLGAASDEIVIGPSTTQLFSNLSLILNLPAGSEIIISSLDHEANISPWVRLAKMYNYTIKWWPAAPDSPTQTSPSPILTPENLKPLLSDKTALVTCTHASNVLGTIHDVKKIAEMVHTIPGAKLCVDGVALAPHRDVDVKALGVDFYAFSWYKVYGPHIAILYASRQAQRNLGSLGHYFHTGTNLETKIGLASASYELVAALPSIVAYFGADKSATWAAIAAHEEKLQDILLSYLRSRDDVAIHGEKSADKELRVPVVSFTVKGKSSKEIVDGIESKSNFGCRWGHFYSKRMVDDLLGLGGCDGVIRVSMVHYNTVEEVERYVKVLDEVLS